MTDTPDDSHKGTSPPDLTRPEASEKNKLDTKVGNALPETVHGSASEDAPPDALADDNYGLNAASRYDESTKETPQEDATNAFTLHLIFGTLALLGVWTLLVLQLQLTWSLNPQYAHGFLVPLLCLYLALKPPPQDLKDSPATPPRGARIWALSAASLGLFLLLPLWIVGEANSDWRLLNLALFVCVAAITFALAYDCGGFPQVKILAFPVLFFLVAIPWPLKQDLELTQWLQGRVSALIVDALLLLDEEVTLHGNIIDAGTFGQIGVDEACSGIQGLQASIVISLFLGAHHHLGPIHRIAFCLLGAIVALVLNLLRAFTLAFLKVKGHGDLLHNPLTLFGMQLPTLHDLAGWIESAGILVTLLILARLARGSIHRRTSSDELYYWSNLRIGPPLALGIPATFWLLAIPILAHLHFRSNEADLAPMPHLNINFEDRQLLTQSKHITSLVEAQLHYQEASSTEWQHRAHATVLSNGSLTINHDAEYWQGFLCSWESGGACTAILATHSPEACLPLSGLVQISPRPGGTPTIVSIPSGAHKIPFEAYQFAQGPQTLHVFRCFWPNKLDLATGSTPGFPKSGYDFSGRIKAAIEGRRNVGGSMLALCVANVSSQEEAIAKLHREVKERLVFRPDGS